MATAGGQDGDRSQEFPESRSQASSGQGDVLREDGGESSQPTRHPFAQQASPGTPRRSAGRDSRSSLSSEVRWGASGKAGTRPASRDHGLRSGQPWGASESRHLPFVPITPTQTPSKIEPDPRTLHVRPSGPGHVTPTSHQPAVTSGAAAGPRWNRDRGSTSGKRPHVSRPGGVGREERPAGGCAGETAARSGAETCCRRDLRAGLYRPQSMQTHLRASRRPGPSLQWVPGEDLMCAPRTRDL